MALRVANHGWMENPTWLRERAVELRFRILEEEDPEYLMDRTPSGQRARRQALAIVEDRLRELEAV